MEDVKMGNTPFILFQNDSLQNKAFVFTYHPLDSAYLIKEEDFIDKYVKVLGEDSYANLIATGALILTLITFIVQSYISDKERKLSVKQNWFLTVVVQPNLAEINNFYSGMAEKLDDNICNIRTLISLRDILHRKAQANRSLKEFKSSFFDNFVTIVQSYNKELANDIDDALNRLQDLCSRHLDRYGNYDFIKVKREIFANKAELINLLYQGITSKPWYSKIWLKVTKVYSKIFHCGSNHSS